MKTRIKMRQMPGDVSKREKAAMMEKKREPHPLFGSVKSNERGMKTFRKMILSRERAVLRERTRKEIERDS